MNEWKVAMAAVTAALAKETGIQHTLLLEQRYYSRKVDELAKRWEERLRKLPSVANRCEVEKQIAALKGSAEEYSAAVGNMAFIWAVVEYNTAPVAGVSYSARVKAFPLECARNARTRVRQIAEDTQETAYGLLNDMEELLAGTESEQTKKR